MIISEQDALSRIETIVSRMEAMLRHSDSQSRDWTEEFDLMARMLAGWTRWLSTSAKTEWSFHKADLKVQYARPVVKREKPEVVDTSGDTYGGKKLNFSL